MRNKAALIGLIAVSLICDLSRNCAAQEFTRTGLALDNPALFRTTSLPGSFNTGILSSNIAFDWTIPMSPLPPLPTTAWHNVSGPATSAAKQLPDRLNDWAPKLDYVTGEVGFLYGRATGKYGGDFMQSYIIGEVGDDKFHITVGAAYEESNFRLPRQIR